MQEHETEMIQCGSQKNPTPSGCNSYSFTINKQSGQYENHRVNGCWSLDAKCVEVPWFQPTKEVVEVDGLPVVSEVVWGGVKWTEPLGIVQDIHMHW